MVVLVLATNWRFGDLRKRAIGEVKSFSSLSEKMRLAGELMIPAWRKEAYLDLIKRDGPLLLAEAEQLGMVKTLALYDIREMHRHSCYSGMSSRDILSKVNQLFAEELGGMHKTEVELYPTKEEKRALVEDKYDADIDKIVQSWSPLFDNARARQLGFSDDIPFIENIKKFASTFV